MLDPLILEPTLKCTVVKFGSSIRLQTVGLTSLFQNLVKGLNQSHAGFDFQRLHPRVLGQDIQHGQ